MSRLGKKPIKIPKRVQIELSDEILTIKGPKGEMKYRIPKDIKIKKKDDILQIISPVKKKEQRVIYGLVRAKIANMIKGINFGFRKRLELFGVGYTASIKDNNIILTLGYSHPIKIKKPKGIEIEIKKNEIEIFGVERQKVGQFAAKIHNLKRAEPYKGKGFKYTGEVIRRKVGKAALKTEGEAETK